MDSVRLLAKRPFWFDKAADDGGFSSVGVSIALFISLALVFTGAQVYRVESASAEIQEVADAAALAADNVIAEYYIAARVCDAVLLSLSLTGIVVTGIGIAALCAPSCTSIGVKLIDSGKKILKARDSFAERATSGLNRLQKLLPYLAAVNAARVAQANEGAGGSGYFGFAVTLPFEGEILQGATDGEADAFLEDLDEQTDVLKEEAEEAEEAAHEAREAKERAYQADCGARPGYCQYERAFSLAGLEGSANPVFSSVDTWGFSVALDRARKYYERRLAIEKPASSSVEEQANSALRTRFYRFAIDKMKEGWVRESDSSFSANFPLLPKNTSEMRKTELYTEAVYPVSTNEAGAREMHAWDGCPRASGATELGSLAQQEQDSYAVCSLCRLTPASMGKIAAATSSVATGFEYHYRIVAEAAEDYETAKEKAAPANRKVRARAQSLFEKAIEVLKSMAAQRIDPAPPGRYGVVAFVVSTQAVSTEGGFASGFTEGFTLGTRAAISGATLVSDTPEQGRNVIASALDGVRERGDVPLGGLADGVMDVWAEMLFAYAQGQEKVTDGFERLDLRVSFASESGLGKWAANKYQELLESLGLEPAQLDAPKPVLVNTGHILQTDTSEFSVRMRGIRKVAANLEGGTVFDALIGATERRVSDELEGFDGTVTIAEIEVAGEGFPSIPLTVTLPFSASDALGTVESIAQALRGIASDITGVRQWR